MQHPVETATQVSCEVIELGPLQDQVKAVLKREESIREFVDFAVKLEIARRNAVSST
jgi:hypothetical protein